MKISPTLKATVVLALIYIVGLIGLHFLVNSRQSEFSAFGGAIAFVAWLFIFPIIALIIIISVIIMELVDAKRNKAKTDLK